MNNTAIHFVIVYDENSQAREVNDGNCGRAGLRVERQRQDKPEGGTLAKRLSTWIEPPMSSISCLEMAKPNPVPPYRRVVEASTWVNFSKSAPIFSGGMPIPVSFNRTGTQTIAVGISAPTGTAASRILVAWWRHERVCVYVAILGDILRAVYATVCRMAS